MNEIIPGSLRIDVQTNGCAVPTPSDVSVHNSTGHRLPVATAGTLSIEVPPDGTAHIDVIDPRETMSAAVTADFGYKWVDPINSRPKWIRMVNDFPINWIVVEPNSATPPLRLRGDGSIVGGNR
ncbi:MAG: hypothetical protein KDB27_16980 [Planctomycetales bacterium]|nr:hypothetical protein [Planctomycetales bacterium]